MTESQTYDACLAKMAQVVADIDRAFDVLAFGNAPVEMCHAAWRIRLEAEEAMRGLVELRLGVM